MCVLACPKVLRNDRQGEGRRVKVRIKDLGIKKEQQRMRQKETEKRLRYKDMLSTTKHDIDIMNPGQSRINAAEDRKLGPHFKIYP